MALINCPSCGKEISDKAKECPQCGQILAQDSLLEDASPVLCEECGAEIPVESNVCPNCGYPVSTRLEADESSPQKVEITAVNISKSAKKYVIIALVAIVFLITTFFYTFSSTPTAEKIAGLYTVDFISGGDSITGEIAITSGGRYFCYDRKNGEVCCISDGILKLDGNEVLFYLSEAFSLPDQVFTYRNNTLVASTSNHGKYKAKKTLSERELYDSPDHSWLVSAL